MKTLILNGSPRKDGDTVFLINKLLYRLQDEYKIIDCYTADIAPCIDCRCCREKLSCLIKDEMQEFYAYLAMPISWSGTLSQYVGRLHREYEGKNSVMIYDYADIHVRMLENMYKKRLREYAKLGYASELIHQNGFQTIYTEHYKNDLFREVAAAKKTVIAAGAYFISGKLNLLMRAADQCMMNGAKVVIITKKADNTYAERMHQMMVAHGVEHHIKNKIPSSFVVIDRKTVWYASGELFGNIGDDCVLRIEDEVLAGELTESIHEFRV